MIHLTLAQAAVTDIEAGERWYSTVLGSPPDTRPMDGLLEWRFGAAHGIQVFLDADRAGKSTILLGVTGFDDEIERLSQNGIDHSGVQPGGGGNLVVATDPDGNRVVFLDAAAAAATQGDAQAG